MEQVLSTCAPKTLINQTRHRCSGGGVHEAKTVQTMLQIKRSSLCRSGKLAAPSKVSMPIALSGFDASILGFLGWRIVKSLLPVV